MSAQIRQLTKPQMQQLVFENTEVKLSPTQLEMFSRCLRSTTGVWAGFAEGRLVCTWGLIPPTLLSDEAYLWLYTTEAVHDHEFLFVRNSQRAIEGMLKLYPIIRGHVAADAPRSVRWIKWLGATFDDPVGKMILFTIRGKHG